MVTPPEAPSPALLTLPGQLPRAWVVVDCETTSGRPEQIETDFRRDWSPDHRWKADTLHKRYAEAREKFLERGALLESGRAKLIAVKTDVELLVFHALGEEQPRGVDGAIISGFPDRRSMLIAFRQWMELAIGPDTLIAAFNLPFDAARLRVDFLREGLQLPSALADRNQPRLCIMRHFCHHFALKDRKMISLGDACEIVGMQHHKDLVSGAEVGGMVDDGKVDLLCRYAVADVLVESRLMQIMLGHPVPGVE